MQRTFVKEPDKPHRCELVFGRKDIEIMAVRHCLRKIDEGFVPLIRLQNVVS